MAQEIANHSAAALTASKEVIDVATSTSDAVERGQELNPVLRRSEEHASRFRGAADRITKQRGR
jgi:bacterioferritin (cytochrome b1)